MTEKRLDLQGLRGIAILLVLIFHLKPGLFPSGFISVDMFFVLSGYLITMIFSKRPITSDVVIDFYKRRFRRIVPLFASILLMVYTVCWFYLLSGDRMQLLTDLKWSLTFTSNIQPLFENKGYWDQITSYRFLVYCWSLGVEIQFYLVAPLVVGYFRHRNWHFLVYLLCLFSLCAQLLAPPKMAYGLLPCRLWQFLGGTIGYDVEQLKFTESTMVVEEKKKLIREPLTEKPLHNRVSSPLFLMFRESLMPVIVFLVVFNQNFLDETKWRLLGTFLTMVYIFTSSFAGYSFLSLKPLVYIGDISYTLYLIHWPVIVFYKYYYSLEELDLMGVYWCLLLMFLCSVVIHHTLEDHLVRLSIYQGLLVFAMCILFISLTSNVYKHDVLLNISATEELGELDIIQNGIKYNTEIDVRQGIEVDLDNPNRTYTWQPCKRDFEAEKWTGWTEEPQMRCVTRGNGTLNVLVVGNSIAYRAFPRIHQLLGERYNILRLFTRSILPGIYASDHNPTSRKYEKALRKLIEVMKPDVVFIIFTSLINDNEGHEMQAPIKNITTDQVRKRMQKNIDHYSNYSRRIVIEMPYYTRWYTVFLWEVNKRLKLGKSLDDLKITKMDLDKQQRWQHERLRHLTCSKCILNDINEALFTGDEFYFYDRKTYHSYYQDGIHLTYAGLDLLMENYKNVIERVIKELDYFCVQVRRTLMIRTMIKVLFGTFFLFWDGTYQFRKCLNN